MTRSRFSQLSLALLVAAAVHVGAFVLLSAPADRGHAMALGSGGVTVSLGPSGRAPGGAPSEPIERVAEVDAPEPLADIAKPERMEMVRTTVMPVADRPTPVEEAIEVMEAIEAVTEAAEPERMELAELPIAPVVDQPAPTAEAIKAIDLVEPIEAAQLVRAVAMTPPLPPRRPATAPEPTAMAAPQPPGNGGQAGTTRESETGNAVTLSGGGQVGALADYDALLVAWLERHKRYPRRAQLQRRQGVVLVRFIVDGSGEVVRFDLVESSGHDILDREGLETIRRASPMPTPPAGLAADRLERVVPIAFSLR